MNLVSSTVAKSTTTPMSTDEIRHAYRDGCLSPVDILEQTFEAIEAANGSINAVVMLNQEEARKQAEKSAERWAAGKPIGDLDGIPISLKDSVNSVGTPWRHGTLPNRNTAPATLDAPPAARLKEAGAIIFGKCAMPDFGMLASGVSSLYGTTRNPWNLSMNTGGSSAGAGASLAAGIGSMSVGSDIAGSVRLPAAHCGIAALKPTQGRISHLAPSTTRSAGPMARTIKEVTELFDVLSIPDRRDFLSLPSRGNKSRTELNICDNGSVRGLKVGLVLDMGYGFKVHPEVEKVVREAAQVLSDSGAEVAEVEPLFSGDPYAALDRLFQVRALAEWLAFDAQGRTEVLPEIIEWCRQAENNSAFDHENDLNAVAASTAHFSSVIDKFDVTLSPVIPGLGFTAEMVGLNSKTPLEHCSFTCWYNQSGQPAASVGFGFSQGMPINIQIGGPRFSDEKVLGIAGWLEARRPQEFIWPTKPRDMPQIDSRFFAADYEKDSAAW